MRSRLTLDNKSTRDVRVYLIDEAGQSQLKQILRPYQTSVIDAVEGQAYQLVDDREGWHLGWIRQLAVATLVSVPDQRTPAGLAGAALRFGEDGFELTEGKAAWGANALLP